MNPAAWIERHARRRPDEPALALGERVHANWREFAARAKPPAPDAQRAALLGALTDREREVVDAVFALRNRASAEDIRAHLKNPPSYSAVRAMLARRCPSWDQAASRLVLAQSLRPEGSCPRRACRRRLR